MSLQTIEVPVPDRRRLRVLLVDDDALQLRAMERLLRDSAAIELRVADNAIDAMLAIGSVKPDAVVLDAYMPGLDGLEVCRRLRANDDTRDMRIILASATMDDDLARAAKDAGATQTVAKPFDLVTLLAPPPVERLVVEVEPVTIMRRGADVLVDMLVEAGVDVVFGLPGGAISPVHDALLDSPLRVVTTRHEAGAMFAAAAHARCTGRLAVVAVTSGPGVLNAMTGLATAWCDGVPVLLLIGEVPRAAHGKGVLQDGSAHGLQIVEMARYVTKLAVEVPRASALPHLLRRGIATALSGRRGPVALTLPMDVTTAQLQPPRSGGAVTMSGMVTDDLLDEVAELVRDAKRPLLVAGHGVRGDGAPIRLRAVAERLGIPVATTPKGKGVFPETHPLALGVLGLGGHLSARRYLDEGVDVVLAVGTSLGDLATDGFAPQLQASRALVHVDIDVRQVGRSYSPTHAIVAPAAEFLGGLADRVEGTTPRMHPGLGVVRHALASSVAPNKVAPHDALVMIEDLLPSDTIFTVDSGDHFTFAVHYLTTTLPDAFLVMTGLGSMGQSIGAAVGAQLAHPDRTIAAICGDGCFAMNAFEIATAVAERLPIRVFVFNDERLGMVERGHEHVYGRHPEYPTNPLDVCSIAHGLGARTLRIERVGQLAAARAALLDRSGPLVVDVQIDPSIALPKKDRVAATMAPGGLPQRPKVVN